MPGGQPPSAPAIWLKLSKINSTNPLIFTTLLLCVYAVPPAGGLSAPGGDGADADDGAALFVLAKRGLTLGSFGLERVVATGLPATPRALWSTVRVVSVWGILDCRC